MDVERQPISITIKVPFACDTTLDTFSDVTVEQLIETIITDLHVDTDDHAPQCIVYNGRILPHASTLATCNVSDHSVLHLMRRPRDPTNPGRRNPSAASRTATMPDGNNSGNVSEAPNEVLSDDDDHPQNEHAGDPLPAMPAASDLHETHNFQANIVIGPTITTSGRIQYSDAHDLLLSILHALGFSTRAVRSAAAVAAAVAIATHSPEERGAESARILQHAWHSSRGLQLLLSQHTDSLPEPHEQPNEEHTQQTTTTPIVEHLAPNSIHAQHNEEAITETVAVANQCDSASEIETQLDAQTTPASGNNDHHSHSSHAGADADADEDDVTADMPQSLPPDLIPENPPQQQNGDTELQTAARGADRLLPTLASLLEQTGTMLREAPSLVDVAGSDRMRPVERLTERLGSLANVVTVITTLVSAVIPDPENIAATEAADENAEGDAAATVEQSEGHDNSEALSDSATRGGSDSAHSGTNQTSSVPEDASMEAGTANASLTLNSRTIVVNAHMNTAGVHEANPTLGRIGEVPVMDSHGVHFQEGGPWNLSSRSRGSSTSRGHISNADFIVRVLSYYMRSIWDEEFSGEAFPSEFDTENAVSVLDDLYGGAGARLPKNLFLRIMHFAMRKLSPRQFHNICRGDMRPIVEIRHSLWREISRVVRRYHCLGSDNNVIQATLLDYACEAIHEFVHILGSGNEANSDGYYTDPPEEFCHQVMHVIYHTIEEFTGLLFGSLQDEECSGLLAEWVREAPGEVLLSITTALQMSWDDFLRSFRRAANEIGESIVGSQFSVIFPFIINLYADRLKIALERSNSHAAVRRTHRREAGSEADLATTADHSRCDSDCLLRLQLSRETSANRSHHPHRSDVEERDDEVSTDGSSDLPTIDEEEFDSGMESEEDINPSMHDDSDEEMDSGSLSDPGAAHAKPDVNTPLNSDELLGLASELDANDRGGDSQMSPSLLGDMELEHMATELAGEHDYLGLSAKPSSQRLEPTQHLGSHLKKEIAAGTKGSTISPSVTTPPGISGLRSLGTPSNSGANFSSTAVPRNASARDGTSLQDEFEQVLGASGSVWKQVVDQDRRRVQEEHYGPLSKAYFGDAKSVRPLTKKTASTFAATAAKEAAKMVNLSRTDAAELERAASENGGPFMTEMERTIASRLRSDPDFDESSYPRAAKRFL